MRKPKRCSMPECPDFAKKGNSWCYFHIKEAEQEMREMWKVLA